MGENCQCEKPGYYYYSGVPGILAHIENGQPVGEIRYCEICQRYANDDHARFTLLAQTSKKPPSLNPDRLLEQVELLIKLYGQQPYAVDRLPYTKIFEAMVDCYNQQTKRHFSPYVIYGCLMVLRKQERLPYKK